MRFVFWTRERCRYWHGTVERTAKAVFCLGASKLVVLGLAFMTTVLPTRVLADDLSGLSSSLSTSLSPTVPPAKKKTTIVKWTIEMSGESFANDKEQAQTAGFGLVGDLRQILLPGLEIKANAKMDLESGYAQSQFGENTPRSGVFLNEAVLQYRPIQMITLQAGAINQSYLKAPLLIADQPFPGALQKISFGSRAYNVELISEETIPTSTTLSTEAVAAESKPSFLAQTLAFQARPLDYLILRVWGTHYTFSNLPSNVALQSSAYGNTVTELGPNTSAFTYDFDGWLAGGESKWRVADRVDWKIEGYVMANTQVAESYGQAQDASTSLDLHLPKGIVLMPKAEVFFVDSDASPGFYNSSEYGHNNRDGWGAEFTAKFEEQKFKIGIRYIDAEVINPNVLQSRQQFIMLRLESHHDLL